MKYIDLTMSIEDAPVYPGDPKCIFERIATFATDGWNEHKMTFALHIGTHIDFPLHMIDNGKSQNAYKLNDFIGTGKIIDVRGQTDIEAELYDVEAGDILLLWTGYSDELDTEKYFDAKSCPKITQKFADEIVKKKLKLVGIDSWSPDVSPFPIHKTLLGNDILIVENLINLKELSGKKFKIFVAPLCHNSFDGSPARVFAEIE